MHSPAQESVKKGFLLGLLGLFRNIEETGSGRLRSECLEYQAPGSFVS